MACETFTNYKTKLDNALDGTPFSGAAPTQILYASGLVPGKSLSNCILVDGIGGLYIGISTDDINPGAFGSEAESFIFILFCNCYSACIKIGASDDYGATLLDDIWPITSTSKYKECGISGTSTGRPTTLRDDYYYYKLVNKTIRGKIDISSAIGEAQIGGEQKNVPTITGMYALTTPLQTYQSLSAISNLVINCTGENSCFSDQAIGVFEFTDNTYSFHRWCAKINTATTVAYGPQLGDLNILRKTYDAYANEAFMGAACNIPDKSNAQYSHKAVTDCPALIECGAGSMGECTDPFWNTALQGNITEGGTSSACYIKPYPIRMLDSLGGTVCYTPDLLTFFVDAITYLKPYAGLCLEYTCTNFCVGSADPNCIIDCKNAWNNQYEQECGIPFEYTTNNCKTVQSSEADNIRAELLDRTTSCTSGTAPICDFQESLSENGDIIVSQIEKNITCTPSEEANRDCTQYPCCFNFVTAGLTCYGGGTRCDDNLETGEPGGTYYACSDGVVQNGCACVESGEGTPITPPIGIYTQTINECFKQNINGSYNIVVKV